MTPERWQQIEAVLQQALDRPPHERQSFLDRVREDDPELGGEAASLVDAHEQSGDFIELPAIAHDARVLIGTDLEKTVGREVGPYSIIKRLGGGGMGEVFLAQDNRLNRLVALKILPDYFASDEARLRRFQTEARAASALNHPNILTIHEVGESEGLYFIATEFIDGQTLRDLLADEALQTEDVAEIAIQVGSALSAAHAAGIVHRDIKPENIMRRADGLVKILDFGIAKLLEQPANELSTSEPRPETEVGVVMGTVDYMSPEQARGLVIDERTDIWSLGVVLYEMTANQLPFTGATRMDTLVGILERSPRPTPKAGPFNPIIEKALQKKRADRYQSVAEMLADLRSARTDFDKHLNTSSADTSFKKRVALLVIASVLVAVFAGMFLYKQSQPKQTQAGNSATAAVNKLYVQMTDEERLAFVREQEQRISAMMGDRPAQLNSEALQAIKRQVDRYVNRHDKSRNPQVESLTELYQRAVPYVPMIAEAFAARKIPVVIAVYLPMIESAYKPCVVSEIGAKGLFQFLPKTARIYGVADKDLCNAEKVAPAAAAYVADHMAELGDDSQSMTLVLLSYNRGATWVRTTLRELRDLEGYERNFWTLFEHRDKLDESFRNEGAGYVLNFFAAAIIGENPQAFNLSTPPLSTMAR